MPNAGVAAVICTSRGHRVSIGELGQALQGRGVCAGFRSLPHSRISF